MQFQKPNYTLSARSRRVARNTVLLYFRMLLMMFIGMFTARVVLKALGVDNYGIYGAVGGIVTMFTVVTNSISQSISRYITVELGHNDMDKLKRVFSTAVVLQIMFCALVVLLTETFGLWWLHHKINLPPGRMGAAVWVLQGSMGILMANLLSVPYNAVIIAHEKMGAFALISIFEAILKLLMVAVVWFLPGDKLIIYALMMLAVSILVRFAYASYCHHYFEESRTGLTFDRKILGEMTGFAGWNILGSGAYIINTQGVNLLANWFFGVGINAARLVTTQVENIIRQFVNNFLTAINPQITKTYVGGDNKYCFELVSKGVKFACLVMLVFLIPLELEAHVLVRFWLGEVPPYTAAFIRWMMVGIVADMMLNPLLTLIQADGRIKIYYAITSTVSLMAFALSWIAFQFGAEPHVSYILFAAVYFIVDAIKLITVHRLTKFPLWEFVSRTIVPLSFAAMLSFSTAYVVWSAIPQSMWRLLVPIFVGWATLALCAYMFCLTDGEKNYIKSFICR